MNENGGRLREALTKIAEVASAAVSDSEYQDDAYDNDHALEHDPQQDMLACTPKTLPKRLLRYRAP